MLIAACAAGLITRYELWRYLSLLLQTQYLNERSTCKLCGTYGRYRLVGATPKSMTVSCRKCNAEWTIR